MRPLQECRLYTFLDSSCVSEGDFPKTAKALCEGGSDLIQLRMKEASLLRVRQAAAEVAPILKDHNVGLVINDHWALAEEIGADLAHLGQEDFFDAGHSRISEIRSGNRPLIGLSTHAPDQALRAVAAGADYAAIGPVYATPTKPSAPPVTLQYVKWAATNIDIPWFAIGGIHLQNLDQVLAAGARRICVVSAILRAPDIKQACLEFKKRIISAEL